MISSAAAEMALATFFGMILSRAFSIAAAPLIAASADDQHRVDREAGDGEVLDRALRLSSPFGLLRAPLLRPDVVLDPELFCHGKTVRNGLGDSPIGRPLR